MIMSNNNNVTTYSEHQHKLNELVNQLNHFCIASDNVEVELHRALDEFNALDYSLKFTEDSAQILSNILHQFIWLINPSSEHLLSKWCLLVVNVVAKQQVSLETAHLHSIVQYLLNSLKQCGSWVHPDVLTALSAVLYENVGRVEKFWDALTSSSGILMQLVKKSAHDGDTYRCTLKCLQNLTIRSKKVGEPYLREDLVTNCFLLFLQVLRDVRESDQIARCKIAISCLRGIHNLLSNSKLCPSAHLGELLGTLKSYLFYGLPGYNVLAIEKLYPSPLCQSIVISDHLVEETFSYNRITAQKHKTRKKRAARKKTAHAERDDEAMESTEPESERQFFTIKMPNSNSFPLSPVTSSDSEYSDSEAGQAMKLRSLQVKVRMSSYMALHATIRTAEKKLMFGYWSAFLPDSPPSEGLSQSQTLLTTILKDPSSQVRSCALAVLADLLDGSKQFLCLAEERTSAPTAFTSLSATLASTIKELHRCLLLALLAESRSDQMTIQHLKCISILVTNVPYHRMQPGHVSRLFKNLIPFLQHRDMQVRVACLTVVGSILSIQPSLPEVTSLFQSQIPREDMQQGRMASPSEDGGDANPCSTPWLVSMCSDNILGDPKHVSLPVRLESLQVLAVLCSNHFAMVEKHIDIVLNLVLKTLEAKDQILQQHGAKLLYATGKSMAEQLNSSVVQVAEEKEALHKEAVSFWESLFCGPLPACLGDASHGALRAACCDCLSNIGATVFQGLKRPSQMLCLSLVLGLVHDEEPNVRGSAVRCLGIYTLYPLLAEDMCFLTDVSESVVSAMKDSQFVVRFKAVWALGNLTDSLLMNRDKDFLQHISVDFLRSVGSSAVHAAGTDHDKIRSHAVRALGNILYFVPVRLLEKEALRELVNQACHLLILNLSAGLMKVRWNACYALGNLLRNTQLLQFSADNPGILCIDDVFDALLKMMTTCSNFKVRINAVAALGAVSCRSLYGTHYANVWLHCLDLLQSGSEVSDFAEVKHRDNLCSQLCWNLLHLASLLEKDDIAIVASPTLALKESLFPLFKKCRDFMGKGVENVELLLEKVNQNMMNLMDLDLSAEEQQLLAFLLDAVEKLGS